MTSKNKLSEQILRILSGGNISRDAQVSLQELSIAVSQEFAIAVKINYFQNRQQGVTELNGSYIYTFTQPVLKDVPKNLFYTELPSAFIDLPHEMGVNQISYVSGQTNPFARVSNGFLGLMSGLDLDGLQNRVGFWIENDRIYYINIEENTTNVIMKLAVALDAFDDDTLINIPPDIASLIIDSVLKKYGIEQAAPHDDINNGVKQ